MKHVNLISHFETPCPFVQELSATLVRGDQNGFSIQFDLKGDIAGLSLPAQAASHRSDGLWRHTCFEAFVRPQPGAAYREFNFAPSTAWAAYQFDGYRIGMADLDIAPPLITTSQTTHVFSLSTELCGLPETDIWHVGLSAVIESRDGAISYWAIAHPPGKPDFHHSDCFALEVGATVRS